MHFKNGRLAVDGDPVVCKGYNGKVTTGKIHSLVAQENTCNCTVAEVVQGGVQQLTCQNLATMYHAEDAFNILDAAPAAVAPAEKAE